LVAFKKNLLDVGKDELAGNFGLDAREFREIEGLGEGERGEGEGAGKRRTEERVEAIDDGLIGAFVVTGALVGVPKFSSNP